MSQQQSGLGFSRAGTPTADEVGAGIGSLQTYLGTWAGLVVLEWPLEGSSSLPRPRAVHTYHPTGKPWGSGTEKPHSRTLGKADFSQLEPLSAAR